MLTLALFSVGLFIFNIILPIYQLAQVPLSCLSPPSITKGDYFCTLSFVNHCFRWWRALEGFWAGIVNYYRGVFGKTTKLCSAREFIKMRGWRGKASVEAVSVAQGVLRIWSRTRNLCSLYGKNHHNIVK